MKHILGATLFLLATHPAFAFDLSVVSYNVESDKDTDPIKVVQDIQQIPPSHIWGLVEVDSADLQTYRTAIGRHALLDNANGTINIALGAFAGKNITGHLNIAIGNQGVAGESQTLRIGNPITIARAFIAGISGTNVGASNMVFVNSSGQKAAPQR